MCARTTRLTAHHLIPKSEHPRFVRRGRPSAWLLGPGNIALLCRPCHTACHRAEPNARLADAYHTVALLLAHPKVAAWVAFAAGQRVGTAAHGLHNRR